MTPAMHHELPGVSIPVTAEMEQRYRDWRLSRVGEGALRARLRVFLDDTPFADSVPPFDQMLAGPNGTLWLRRYRMPWLDDDTTATDRWMQLDRERRVVRECLAPPQLRPMAWERDRVLGVWRDELRVEHPVVARLTTIDGEPCP
jgi:hypothetical protein